MPRFEIELDDKGELAGDVPAELTGLIERREIMAHGNGFRGGQTKAGEDAKAQLESAIKAERTRLEAQQPLEREKWQAAEEENKTLKTQLTNSMRESSKTLQQREEAHAEEITRRADSLNKRNQKIQALVTANLRALAASAGARDESLSELEVILQHRIGYDDDMEPFVKGEDGQPAKLTNGNPVGIDVFVKQYLDNHPHHRKPTPGQGGGARGGATLRGGTHGSNTTGTAAAASQRIMDGDRSPAAINELFEASRSKRAS